MLLASPSYTVQLVASAGGDPVYASALNKNGTIGGQIWDAASNNFNAFVWDAGQLTIVAKSPAGDSGVSAINSAGVVVGFTTQDTGGLATPGFVYRDGVTTILPATTMSMPRGINDAGVIVGWADGTLDAATFDGRQTTDLGRFGGLSAQGVAINNRGQIVALAMSPTVPPDDAVPFQYRAFLWDGTTSVQLESLGGYDDTPRAINDAGVVIGSDAGHAVKWVNGIASILGDLRGGDSSSAASINSAGVTVGNSVKPDGTTNATLWTDSGPADLNALIPPGSGWQLLSATAINDLGQIVGNGTYLGQPAAFLLTPTNLPDPSPVITLTPLALATTGLYRRRRRPRD